LSIQLATSTRNAMLDAIETDAGTSAKLAIYTGSVPANCAADTTGTKLAEFDLASDWAANASGGSKSFSSTPLTTTGAASGTAGYFRLFTNAQSTTPGTSKPCQMQGTITATGGGGDMTLDNTSIATSQTINVTSFTITAGNA
jgi:hypothetical protein